MSNIQTGAERMPHDLSHLGFLAGQIGRLITISTTPVIAGDSFEDRKSGSAGMPRPISYAVFCLKKKNLPRGDDSGARAEALQLHRLRPHYLFYFVSLARHAAAAPPP